MIFNFKQDLKKIKFIQQLNAKEFSLLEKIVDNHIGKHKIKLKETCLIRLFRFEIMRFYSDYISKKNEKHLKNNFPKLKYNIFPNINFNRKKVKVNFNFTKARLLNFKKKSRISKFKKILINIYNFLIPSNKIVGLRASSISVYDIFFKLIFRRYRVVFLNDQKIDKKNLMSQKKNLLSLFKEIDGALRIAKSLNSSKNLLNFINLYTSDNSIINEKIDILITGTLNDISNRIIAFNLKNSLKNIKIINIAHGNNWIWNEEFTEISEFEYSDYFLSYGFPRKISQKINKKLLYKPKVIGSSCDEINNINQNNLFPRLLDTKKFKFLYVSRDYQIIGPLPHMFSDKVYNRWHKFLLSKSNDIDLTIKIHPKAKTAYDYNFFSNSNKIESTNYINEDIIKKYDVFIFDTMTSAFTKIAASKKHIIFFNLKERKSTKNAMELIKKRTNFFEIDQLIKFNLNNIKLKREKILNNEFIENYALYKKMKRSESLIQLIDSFKI
tara:strand:- start:4301 stop:5791 length:1491 start_codon:yes stop_codon:yes gene_type:complete